MYRPPFIVFDVETEENGYGSTEFYRPAFRVVSAAFSWFSDPRRKNIQSEYTQGETATGYYLERLAKAGIPLCAHNAQFEIGVLLCRYPELANRLLWHADTMRLVQNYDHGGDEFAVEVPILSLDEQLERIEREESIEVRPESVSGLGLAKSVRRILKRPDHKKEAHDWLRANVPECRKGQEGSYLNRLPADILKRYNVGDTEEALRLYKYITEYFASIGFDWRIDHALHFRSMRQIVEAQIRGVPVNRSGLETSREALTGEIDGIGRAFLERFAEPIRAVERGRLLDAVRELKTLRGRKKRVRRVRADPRYYAKTVRFNVGSNKQLEKLFVDQLGMVAKFTTAKGAPAFRSAVLGQWGEGGMMLAKRRKRMIVLKQIESLLALSEHDGKWHIKLKLCGAASSRYAGGSH